MSLPQTLGPALPVTGAGTGPRPLADAHGRVARDLRISLTDRCNLRCDYCMPAEGLAWQPKAEQLTAAELLRVARVLASLGVASVRLTGGEPLLRRDLPDLLAGLHRIDGIEDVALTTNGVLLARRADEIVRAGGARLNVSLDTADPVAFAALTRRDDLGRVLAGLEAVRGRPELGPLKLNAVALRGVTEPALPGLLAVARAAGAELRFIEPMPLDAGHRWTSDDGVPAAELRALLAEHGDLVELPGPASSTARRYRIEPSGQVVGLIASVTEPFCAGCDRLRLTADGQLRSCLFSHEEADLRAIVRAGAPDDALEDAIREAVWRKPKGHGMDEPGFVPPARPMSAIGG